MMTLTALQFILKKRRSTPKMTSVISSPTVVGLASGS
ncbi:hypothetical protein MUK42_18738 [Musa troglodytarum]|uniref:Uncharacterized protein n=1 Tax=Musa troglodytarum TaxID=320322 RepID=A0A9E7G452_9LILI|nr:hypothetical protein MUK42_18738 [Musa troglodytarum]